MIADPTPTDGWTGRVALVTGAAQGIGASVTRLLAARGVQVMAADIQAIPPELRALPGVHAAPLDVTDPADIARAALFLLSDDARHVTMQHLTVDGGATLGA